MYSFLKERNWRLGVGITFLILALFILNILFSYVFNGNNMEFQALQYNDWHYTYGSETSVLSKADALDAIGNEGNWIKLKEIGNSIGNNKSNRVYYKTNLPNTKLVDPCILFQTNDHAFEFYLDGEQIYSFGEYETFDFKHSPGSPTHMISLPEDYQNKELIIAMKAVSEGRLGIIRAFELDSKSKHLVKLIKMNMLSLTFGFMDILIGIACILMVVVYKQGRKALLSLSFSFIVVGLWSISENPLTQVLYFKPDFWYYVAVIAFYLIPIGVYTFIKHVSNSNKKVFNILILLHFVLFAVSLLLDIAGLIPFINTLIYHYILLVFSYIVCLVIGLRLYFRGSIIALIYTIGLFIFGAFGIYDILGWYFEMLPWKANMAIWGMFIFQMSLLFAMIAYLQALQERFLLFKEKIKAKNSKLKEKEKEINQVMEYDKVKTEFFANVSHELRTPLNIISTTIQLMKMYHEKGLLVSNASNADKYIRIMNQNCNRLVKLVDNIIDVTKIESGFYKLELKNINIVSVVENITMSIEEYIKYKEINLVFDTELEEKIIACDPDAIERIMLNLLSNAIKFSRRGGSIHVTIRDMVDKVSIEVEDTGIGIPSEKLNTVFERFVQVDKSFTRQNEGSGIGLAIVKSLVEMHGGTIELISEIDKGSMFRITLPAEIEGHIEEVEVVDSENKNMQEKVSVELSDIYEN